MAARYKLAEAPEAKIYLQEWRETKFGTQQALGDLIKLAGPTISRYETGEREWGKGYLEALAFAVDCNVGDLFWPPDPNERERKLRSALLSFGVDTKDLGRAVSAVRVFVDRPQGELSRPDPQDGRPSLANDPHELAPSTSQPRR